MMPLAAFKLALAALKHFLHYSPLIFLVSYWLNIVLILVANGGGVALDVIGLRLFCIFCILMATGEICKCTVHIDDKNSCTTRHPLKGLFGEILGRYFFSMVGWNCCWFIFFLFLY
jgi:hypothetical protein